MPGFLAALPAILGGIGAIGGALGRGSRGAAEERVYRNQGVDNQNRLLAQIFNTQQGASTSQYGIQQNALAQLLALQERAEMDRAELGLRAPTMRARQAALGSLLANLQPARVTPPAHIARHMPQMSGGLSPAALSPTARQSGDVLQRQALAALLSGSDVPGRPNYPGTGMLTPPPMLQPPQFGQPSGPGRWESAGALGGLLGGLAGAIGPLLRQPRNDFMAWDRRPPTPPPGVRG